MSWREEKGVKEEDMMVDEMVCKNKGRKEEVLIKLVI